MTHDELITAVAQGVLLGLLCYVLLKLVRG
jgi:hypothetical protein